MNKKSSKGITFAIIALLLMAVLLLGGYLALAFFGHNLNQKDSPEKGSVYEEIPQHVVQEPQVLPHNRWNLVIEPAFGHVTSFRDGIAAVRIGDWESGLWGVIDTEGNFVLPPIFTSMNNTHVFGQYMSMDRPIEFFPVQLDGKWGLLDRSGNEVIPFIYDEIFLFDNGMARVVIGEWPYQMHGLINPQTGEEIVPLVYSFISPPHEGFMEVRVGSPLDIGQVGFIDETGREVIPPIYNFSQSFRYGMVVVGFGFDWQTVGWLLVDDTGREISNPGYDEIRILSENVLAFRTGDWERGQWILRNREGEEISSYIFSDIFGSNEEFVVVSKDPPGDNRTFGLYNFIENRMVIPVGLYSSIHPNFDRDLVNVSVGGWTRYRREGIKEISTGRMVVEPVYDQAFSLTTDRMAIRSGGEWTDEWNNIDGGKWGVVDRYGREILPTAFSSVQYFAPGLFTVVTGELAMYQGQRHETRTGLVRDDGTKVLPIEYRTISTLIGGFSITHIGGRWEIHPEWGIYTIVDGRFGVIDERGNVIIPAELEFDSIMPISENMAAVLVGDKWGFIRIEL